jgi:site-specific DNA recombinase
MRMAGKVVSVIPAKAKFEKVDNITPKMRVAAYCRVSTDKEEQLTSYEAQVAHYTDFIQKNKDWAFAGIYADEGITATNTKKRDEFKRLIEDCMAEKIDMVITKSVSRFARNTVDSISTIRKLKEKNIAVFFEKENINTMDGKGEVLITIMSSLAQEESRNLSTNVKWGFAHRFQNGEVMVNHKRFLGYTKDEEGNLLIDPEGAKVVKRIYREYLEGESLLQIGRNLEADGILTGAGKKKWRPETIKKILQNEKYIGDALLQKTYTIDFLTKKRVKNTGIVPQYYVENDHEPIISRELYGQVQEEMARRANLYNSKGGKKRVYSSRYALSSIVYCGECGEIYRRVHWNNRGKKSIVWRCVSRLEEKGSDCTSETILEETLQNGVLQAINQLIEDDGGVNRAIMQNIETAFATEFDKDTSEIDREIDLIQRELLHYTSAKSNEIAEKLHRLRAEKQELLDYNISRENRRRRIAEINEFLKGQIVRLEEYDDKLVRKLVEKVTVFEGHIKVEFKSGVEIEVKV